MKNDNIKLKIIFLPILFLGLFTFAKTSFAAAPVVFFSDMTDGPTSGWEGSTTKGAAVTIWGNNLGSSRGSSYVTVGGINLTNDSDYAEWGATTNPSTARGMQRITFWLSSSMSLGETTISVTTSEGISGTIPFYTRPIGDNHIYFIDDNGSSDSYDGLAASYSSGNNGPWATPGKARSTLQAGDVAYFREGTWQEKDSAGGFTEGIMSFYQGRFNNGLPNKSVTVASYPGEMAYFDAYTNSPNGTPEYSFGNDYSGEFHWSYWTFSKFKMNSDQVCFKLYGEQGGGCGPYYFNDLRIVGNDMSTGYGRGGTLPIDAGGGQEGSTNLFIYGNFIHDLGVNYRGQGPITNAGRHYPIYIEGYGQWDDMHIGWNEFGWVEYGRGMQIYGHLTTDNIDNLYFHDNYIHDVSLNCLTFGGTDHGYKLVTDFYVYNNIFDMSGGSMPALLCNGESYYCMENRYIYNNTIYQGTSTSSSMASFWNNAGLIDMKNNIFYSNGATYFSGASNATKTGSNNCYYGGGTK